MSGYRPQSPDTTPEIEALLFERLRELPFSERARRWAVACHEARALALAGLRHHHPDVDEHELRLRYAARYVDAETMQRAFGWTPADERA